MEIYKLRNKGSYKESHVHCVPCLGGGNVADIIMGTDKVLALPVSQSNREIEHQQAMATLERPFVWTINLTVSSITLVK